jgi:hypothetical protein
MTKGAVVKIQVVQQHYFILNQTSKIQALENSGDAAQITSGILDFKLLLCSVCRMFSSG